jgi:hypothetical protein
MSKMDRFCETNRITIECTRKPMAGGDMPRGSHEWTCVLKNGRKRLTVDFFQGPAHTSEPSAADVLACLCSDARAGDQDFESFCSYFGYDADSRKVEATYKACARMAKKVPAFLGDLYEAACNAEH